MVAVGELTDHHDRMLFESMNGEMVLGDMGVIIYKFPFAFSLTIGGKYMDFDTEKVYTKEEHQLRVEEFNRRMEKAKLDIVDALPPTTQNTLEKYTKIIPDTNL